MNNTLKKHVILRELNREVLPEVTIKNLWNLKEDKGKSNLTAFIKNLRQDEYQNYFPIKYAGTIHDVLDWIDSLNEDIYLCSYSVSNFRALDYDEMGNIKSLVSFDPHYYTRWVLKRDLKDVTYEIREYIDYLIRYNF